MFGGRHAGGFVGLTDVGSVASVGDSGATTSVLDLIGLGNVTVLDAFRTYIYHANVVGVDDGAQIRGATTSVLDLIGLGNVTVLDAFRTYIYHANVVGVDDGAQIRAVEPGVIGTHGSTRYEGNAGGFVGSVLNGSIKDSSVENLLSVSASSYAGGFAGYAGKNGTVDIDSANVGVGDLIDLLGAQAGVLDVWGAHIESCAVSGVPEGATVSSAARADTALDERNAEGAQNIAGGFVGLGDLSRISDCAARNLGVIRSDQVAGGFIGQTDMSYVVDAQVSTPLLNVLLVVVDQLVQVLYLDKGQDLGVIDLGDVGIPGLVDLLGLKVLSDGNLVYVNVLGLKISVSLSQASADDPTGQQRDVAVVSIGDSTIKLSCDRGGLTDPEEANKANLEAALIKGNRTVVHGCTASGAQGGYDVFGGGASQTADGAALGSVLFAPDASGFAGGFVGHNKEGVFESNEVIHCDVVRGTSGLVGPFSGKTDLESSYKPFSEVSSIEGSDSEGSFNTWSIYRVASGSFSSAATAGGTTFAVAQRDDEGGSEQNRYKVHHFGDVGLSSYDQLKGAVLVGESGVTEPIDAYVSPAKAVLMDDSERPGAQGGITPEPGEGQDPCDANVRMTLQKVWNDNANAGGFRPESISLRLLRTWTDAAGTVHEEQVDADPSTADVADPFVMTSDDASAWTQTWRKVIEGLPVATRDASVQPAKICYYTYYVEEVSYGAYTADISYGYTVSQDETGYVVTITNSLPLPNTGGAGVQLFLWSALACLILACAWFLAQRRRARAKAVAGNVGSKG